MAPPIRNTFKKTFRTEYKCWHAMISRCYNENNACFNDYGGRGIFVCERWRGDNGFVNFVLDMGKRPDYMELDRINNDDGYKLINCRWATRTQQVRNRRTVLNIEINGITKCAAEWAIEKGINPGLVHRRIKLGWIPLDAVMTPVMPKWFRYKLPHQLEPANF